MPVDTSAHRTEFCNIAGEVTSHGMNFILSVLNLVALKKATAQYGCRSYHLYASERTT
jgi:hypothetical protein